MELLVLLLGNVALLTTCTGASSNFTGLNETLQEHSTFSGLFGFADVAGVRSFPPEQDAETRIIGGQEAWAHSWPWQVSLQFSSMPACGGAIIGPQWVLSAAHCFSRFSDESQWTVLAGKHDLDRPPEAEDQLIQVSNIISHHQYNTRTKEFDVALLRLERPLKFDTFVRPIDVWMRPLHTSMKCTITGWGSTHENGPRVNRLQEVNVTIMEFDTCNEYYKGRVMESMFCAGKEEGGVDACQGDSGGPLSCFTGFRHELAGLVSWGVGCGRARKPGVYCKLQQHIQWMIGVMNEAVASPEMVADDSQCGRPPRPDCPPPSLAEVSVTTRGLPAVVINVTESCPFSWPWMVSLRANGRHYCSGALLNHRWVLTAKHCSVSAKEDVVILGVHDLRQVSVQAILVDEVFSPIQDGSFPPQADLALVRLSASARFGPQVAPICIPEEDEELDDSWTCVTAGWGRAKVAGELSPDRLHHAQLSLVNESTCIAKWGDFITDGHVCSHGAGSASCMGDSGAPLFCRKRDNFFLFGMVTWGSWRCGADKPAVFTRVPEYHLWIGDVTDEV